MCCVSQVILDCQVLLWSTLREPRRQDFDYPMKRSKCFYDPGNVQLLVLRREERWQSLVSFMPVRMCLTVERPQLSNLLKRTMFLLKFMRIPCQFTQLPSRSRIF